MITYGNLNSLRQSSAKSYQEENTWHDGYPTESRTDMDLSGSQIASALDDLFSPATVTKQFVINILGVSRSLSKYTYFICSHQDFSFNICDNNVDIFCLFALLSVR